MRRVDADELIVRLQERYVSAVNIGGDYDSAQYFLDAIEEVTKAPTITDEDLRKEAEWNYNKGFETGYKEALIGVRDYMKKLGIGGEDDHE